MRGENEGSKSKRPKENRTERIDRFVGRLTMLDHPRASQDDIGVAHSSGQ